MLIGWYRWCRKMSKGSVLPLALHYKTFFCSKRWVFKTISPSLSHTIKLRWCIGVDQIFVICFLKVFGHFETSAGVQKCVKALADECFKGWCFAREMCRRNATEHSCFYCRRALASMHFPFYYLPPWLVTDCVRLPQEVEYLLDICNVSVANAYFYHPHHRDCTVNVFCVRDVGIFTQQGCWMRCKCWKMFCIFFHLYSPNQINGYNQQHVLRHIHY